MLRALRITLMWLLTVAVPVHGFAAASMLGCVGGQSGAVAAVAAHLHAPGAHRDGTDVHADAHAHHAGEDAMAQAATPHHPDGASDGPAGQAAAKVSAASCSACAACCASAALPATPLVFEPTPAPNAFVLPAPQRVATFVSGGLERPPRSVLA
jgi:Zn-dependent protease with chaperone function